MKRIKRFAALIPALVLWLMASVLFWGWIFTFLTDTGRENKITVFVDAAVPGDTALAAEMEARLAGRVRLVQVRPFTYAMFDSAPLRQADLYLVRASQVAAYRDWFAPLPDDLPSFDLPCLREDGAALGIRVYDAASGTGAASAYIDYAPPGAEAEDVYLFFGRESVHRTGNEGAVDGLAAEAARILLSIR